MSSLRKKLMAAVPVAAVVVLALAPQAMARPSNESDSCESPTGDCMRLSFNSNEEGSQTYVWAPNIADLASYQFLSLGGGQFYSLKNNAASAANFTYMPTTIFYNSNYGGSCDTLSDWAYTNQLHYTYNNDASVRFNYSKSSCYQF